MISERMFKDALYAAGAKQVSHAALKDFNAWMVKFMNEEAVKVVARMHADGRTKVDVKDIGE